MLVLERIPEKISLGIRLLLLLTLLALAAVCPAAAQALYSSAPPVVAEPTQICGLVTTTVGGITTTATVCQNVVVVSGTVATVYFPLAGTTAHVRYQLSATAQAGSRAGVLVALVGTLADLGALNDARISTYLSTSATPNQALDSRVVAAQVVQTQLLTANGVPTQLELVATQPFNQVEVELRTGLNVGVALRVLSAYAVASNPATQVSGLVSRFNTPAASQYSTSGACAAAINNPQLAVDNDLTNYATFATLATLNCASQLTTQLEGSAPGTYRAGFVIGRGADLTDVQLLAGLKLHTYSGGKEQEVSGTNSLLQLSVLPNGQTLVSFQASQPFDAVGLEQVGTLTALNNLRLYYGVGLAATGATPPVLSQFDSGSGHVQVSYSGVGAGYVANRDDAAGPSLSNPTTVQVVAGANAVALRLDLNGTGQAGNRAGVVIGRNSLLDVAALSRITLTTYDDAGNAIESANGSNLLSLSLLPDGRQSLSFNTTRPFTKVSIRIGGAQVLDTTDIYYAFSDNTSGSITILNPNPLPVTLTRFGVRRAGEGHATVSWATASELHSAYFVVERSTDPASGYVAVGRVAAAGTSLSARQYTWQDATPAGTLYYRLRQVDADGRQSFSGVVVLAGSSQASEVSLYPNPAPAGTGYVTLHNVTAGNISLYSSLGQLLRQQEVAEAATQLDTHALPAGLYRVVLRNPQGEIAATRALELQ